MTHRIAPSLLLALTGIVALAHAADPAPAPMSANPLLTESPLPFHYPQFDLIKDEHYLPAFELGMTENLKEIDAIANNPAAPTFDNTIVALERSAELLNRVGTIFFNLSGAYTNPEMQKVQRILAPKLAAHSDAIRLNPKLFARIDALYTARDTLGLDPESARLLWRYHRDFVRSGAKLSDADKATLKQLNSELAALGTQFNQFTLKEVAASTVYVDTREELAGLSDSQIDAAASAAKAAGHEGKFALALQNTTGQPYLTNLTYRPTREKLMAASLARGSRGGEFDTRAIVSAVMKKRAARAALLGAPNFAAYSLEEQTAGSVDVVNKLLAQLAPPAVANARKEAADMQAIIDSEHGGFTLAACDWQLYAEKVRKAKYDFDESALKPYYELNHVLVDGVFFAAHKLYGLTFKERHDLPVYEPTVRVFDVFNEDGTQLAIFLADYYARPGRKNGGAWASAYVPQNGLNGNKPVIANHLNIPRPPEGQPTLLTHDEVRTAFHEFGHALHGMFSHVKYPRFAGTSVPRDFVEFPSQVNEMWQDWPEILQNYAKHYQTGAPIPAELIAKVKATSKFNQGHSTTELVAANIIDQAWHQLTIDQVPEADGVVAFEQAALKKAGVDFAPVPPRYRTTYYSHIMGGYAAGYYSYFWSEVLDAHTVEWFKSHGGLTRANGDFFRAKLLSRGGSADAMQLFRDVVGAEPDIKPFLQRRGLDGAN